MWLFLLYFFISLFTTMLLDFVELRLWNKQSEKITEANPFVKDVFFYCCFDQSHNRNDDYEITEKWRSPVFRFGWMQHLHSVLVLWCNVAPSSCHEVQFGTVFLHWNAMWHCVLVFMQNISAQIDLRFETLSNLISFLYPHH